MKVVMTNHALIQRGGSESYLETVATELRRLGHEVVLFSPHVGRFGERLGQAGYQVVSHVDELPLDADVIHGQHADAVALARTRLPRTPLVFATHSWFVNALEDPPPELGASGIVVFNRITQERMAAHVSSGAARVVRLTQPVTLSFADQARTSIGAVPRRAVAVSRRMRTLPGRLERACAELGIEFDWIGGDGRDSEDARREMRAADIVVAMGRGALEGMAAGRAVLVADESVVAGWVDEDSYARLEDDGFTGFGSPETRDVSELLADYRQELGATARRLMARHHGAQQHAAQLVELYSSVADSAAAAVRPETVAQLSADRQALEQRAVRAEWQLAESDVRVAELERRLARAEHEVDRLKRVVLRLRKRIRWLRRQRDQSQVPSPAPGWRLPLRRRT